MQEDKKQDVLLGKERYEVWKCIFVKKNESNFVLKQSWLFQNVKEKNKETEYRKLGREREKLTFCGRTG